MFGKEIIEVAIKEIAKTPTEVLAQKKSLHETFTSSFTSKEGMFTGRSHDNGNEIWTLTFEEKCMIARETGWSSEVINSIANMDQYNIYKNAKLHEVEINGRKCLCKDIDYDYVDPKTGKTNRELMADGRSPIDSKTGEKIELHHMGQKYDAPLCELCENSEHGDDNHVILHPEKSSWRQDKVLNNRFNNTDRPNYWKNRV